MPGYHTKHEDIAVAGVADLRIRSLLDRQQFADPSGFAAALGISSAAWPLFGLLWPSGQRLAALMALRPVRADERILELGCGLALASLVSHRRGADITASDCHPLAGAFLRENLRLNDLAALPYCHGHWGAGLDDDSSIDPDQAPAPQGRFDLIIGSDVLYERDESGGLAHFITLHAQATAQVLIIDPNRGNRPAFNRRMASAGFVLSESRLDELPAFVGSYKGRLLSYARVSRGLS
ncbi:class I SAM-dependent methyltransferase [Aquabacterium sp.]|uniref:class I SAM-dependent methyltransferase n=1 Tax=Aquabacterium sp. TaxID=1872578 RepID=UPI002BF94689|nr:SAM-dependent methyltransferase [Aquabacterium sp.]HSW03421.1 SAM-dependent methyltransferase [Aquabacterium sp.]